MTYGLQIENPSGKLCISDQRIVPYFLAKATFSAAYYIAEFNGKHVYRLRYSGPAVSGLPLIGMYLPVETTNIHYTGPDIDIVSGSAIIDIYATTTVYGTYGIPQLYIFGLTTPSAGSNTFGLRLYNASGQLTYDADYKPVFFRQIDSVNLYGSYTTPSSVSTKPAFIPFNYAMNEMTINPDFTSSTLYYWRSTFRRFSTFVESDFELISQGYMDAAYEALVHYGRSNNQALPWFDASKYD